MRFDAQRTEAKKSRAFNKQAGLSRKTIIIGGTSIVLLMIGILLFNNSRDTIPKPANEKVTTATPESSNQTSPSQEKSKTESSSPNIATTESSSTNTAQPSMPPKVPSGNFVSNHQPRLDDTVLSTCTTTPAVKCNMTFTKDGVSKSLGEKTTDSDGAAYWTWKPRDVGLTAGSWQITVTAGSGDKTSSANDEVKLEVKP